MIEVPSFMAADPAQRDALQQLRAGGNVLLLKGRPVTADCRARCCLGSASSIIDLSEDRRINEASPTPQPWPPQHRARPVGHSHDRRDARKLSTGAPRRCWVADRRRDREHRGRTQRRPGRPAGDRRADPACRSGRNRSHVWSRRCAATRHSPQAAALHQFAGTWGCGSRSRRSPRDHDAGSRQAQALARGSPGDGEQKDPISGR